MPEAIAEGIETGDIVPVMAHIPEMRFSTTRLLLRPDKDKGAVKAKRGAATPAKAGTSTRQLVLCASAGFQNTLTCIPEPTLTR